MARRKRQTKKSLLTGTTGAPNGLRERMAEYLEALKVQAYSGESVATHHENLLLFAEWCDEREVKAAADVTRPILERYQRHLFYLRKKNGHPLSARTQHIRISTLRGFFRWLARERHVLHNPASELLLPRLPMRLPEVVLTPLQAEAVLCVPDVGTPLGLRDRAMLETLYSTGMRRKELASLTVFSVSAERGEVMIRQGKGNKDRLVPIGERAIGWVMKYLEEVRPQLVAGADQGELFLTATGLPYAVDDLSRLVGDYVRASGVSKSGACHLFRHSMATAMLEAGADIRFIQQMLGHAKLETTQIYTHVSIQKLKTIYAATHPAAKLARREREDPATGNAPAADELLAALAAEAEEDDDDLPD
jgi:integrase/recombinase XerD